MPQFDAEARPVQIEPSAGQADGAPVAVKLLETVKLRTTAQADKACDTDGIGAFVVIRGG